MCAGGRLCGGVLGGIRSPRLACVFLECMFWIGELLLVESLDHVLSLLEDNQVLIPGACQRHSGASFASAGYGLLLDDGHTHTHPPTHARTHAPTHARTHPPTHAPTHARTHATHPPTHTHPHTHTHTPFLYSLPATSFNCCTLATPASNLSCFC